VAAAYRCLARLRVVSGATEALLLALATDAEALANRPTPQRVKPPHALALTFSSALASSMTTPRSLAPLYFVRVDRCIVIYFSTLHPWYNN
jgi:hypothetical protein